MAFDDYEKSASASTPIELYTFVAPSGTRRLTTYHKDVSFGGFTFTAVPASRSNMQVVDLHTDQFDASIELPAAHELVQHYANGVPPQEVSCLIQRYQPSSGIALQMHFGYVGGLTFKGRMGSFRVPSATADQLNLDVPSVICSRMCNHVLYDARCQMVETDYDVITTITGISLDGRTISTAGAVPADVDGGIFKEKPNGVVPWSLHGRLKHMPTGESRTITVQNSLTSFTIQLEFGGGVAGITIGDAVTIFAGCNHTRAQCKAKFANAINFGGHPDLPRSNPFQTNLLNLAEN